MAHIIPTANNSRTSLYNPDWLILKMSATKEGDVVKYISVDIQCLFRAQNPHKFLISHAKIHMAALCLSWQMGNG